MDAGAEASLVGGFCSLQSGTASGGDAGVGSQVSASEGGVGGVVQPSGDYTVVNVPGGSSNTVTLSIGDPSTWYCSCPDNCVYAGKIPPVSGLDYYVTDAWSGWFQTVGGNVHADGGDVTVSIPSTCVGLCDPYLITEDSGGATGLVSYTGIVDVGDGGLTEDGNDWQADTSYRGITTGYNYFARILEENPDGSTDFDGSEPGADGLYSVSGDISTSGSWNIAGGRIAVVLVDGNLFIDDDINVEVGSFLAMIVSGNITIDSDVTNIEGVYIADGVINTGLGTSQLVAEGIFTGWGGFNLQRDYQDSTNNTSPAELFVYRPDLQANAYNYLMRSHYSWDEVAP